MSMAYDDDEEVLQVFEEETMERLADIEGGLLELERSQGRVDGERVHAIFRSAHSIKAGAGLLKMHDIQELAHKAENILQRIRNGEVAPDGELVTVLLEAFDSVNDLLRVYRHGGNKPQIQDRLAALERYL